MKKLNNIGIITFTYGDNYGQRLQNLAVQELISPYAENVYTLKQIKPDFSLKFQLKQYKKILEKGIVFSMMERHRKFIEFDNKYIKYFSVPINYKHPAEFPEKEFDYFVAGSDQIWSPFSRDVNDTMFLTFTSKEKRIALAPSIAANYIPDNQTEKYRDYFNGFSKLSVRENTSAELIKNISNRDAEVLIDPTLAFDAKYWRKYEQSFNTPPKYVLCYFLGSDDKLDAINKYAEKNHCVIVNLLSDRKYAHIGPSEFLYFIDNADLIVTDSYHGMIFSLIFNKKVWILKRGGTNLDMTSRFTTLFEKMNNLINWFEEPTPEYVIDYTKLESLIQKERNAINNYLVNSFTEN